MEIGQIKNFDELKQRIDKGDLDVNVKAGIVVMGNMGSLIAMRESIEKYVTCCGGQLIYYTITAQPLYIVHYNDLSKVKQDSLERKRGLKRE